MAGRSSKKALKKKSVPKSKGRVQKKVCRAGQFSGNANIPFLHQNIGNRGVGQLLQSEPESATHKVENVPAIVESVLRSDSGQPLDAVTRESMQSVFDQDLGQVRVHTGTKAAESADAVNALAYTAGQNVVFGSGQYSPHTEKGRKLLVHELTHTLEQGKTGTISSSSAQYSPMIMRAAKPGEGETPSLFGAGISAPTVMRVGGGILATVYFGKNNFLLEAANFTAVDKLSEELRLMHKPNVMVDGYASKEGMEEYNLSLSEKRRQAVIAILKSRLIGSLDIGGKAHGESEPAVEETAKKGAELESQRALNRRVTIFIVSGFAIEKPKKPIDLSPLMKSTPETTEEEFNRKLREMLLHPPTLAPKQSFSEMAWKKIDEGIDDILRKAKVPPKYRGLVKDGAHKLIEKGLEEALEAALDQTGLSVNEKEAIKKSIDALAQTKF